ncbi:MAG: class I SAM-dependent methyltransferase [Alphaproteobacteria bacterium]|nr:class I SAM-dependent methyltransferase [Alphaproteobacteria bacterium]
MLEHLLTQQTTGRYGSSGLSYTYSELSEDARGSVEKVFADLSSNALNSCVATDEPDTLVAVGKKTFESSFDLFMGINTMHFLPPSQFLNGFREANRVLKNGGILAISLNYASSIKDEEFHRVFSQKSAKGDYWPGYGTTERETFRHIRTARFFQTDWKSAVRASETFRVLASFPPGVQKDVLDLIELHSRQLQGGEIIMNIHDQTSIQKLLEFCGFEVLSCNIYSEIHESKPENSYMGVIARKMYCPNYVDLIPSNEGERKEKIVAEMMSKVEVDTSDIIHLEIRNALQSIMMHPTEKRLYSSAEIDAVLQRGIAYLRKNPIAA